MSTGQREVRDLLSKGLYTLGDGCWRWEQGSLLLSSEDSWHIFPFLLRILKLPCCLCWGFGRGVDLYNRRGAEAYTATNAAARHLSLPRACPAVSAGSAGQVRLAAHPQYPLRGGRGFVTSSNEDSELGGFGQAKGYAALEGQRTRLED